MEFSGYHRGVPVAEVVGLRPRAWIAVGPGFAREEVKALVLEAGAIVGDTVTSLEDIAARIVGDPAPTAMLDAAARQEALRRLLSDRRISSRLPELTRRRRGGQSFWRRLDRSIQAARLVFASSGEEEALHERLAEAFGASQEESGPRETLRGEVRRLAGAYEAWLEAKEFWDPPRLLRTALQQLETQGWPERLRKPERIVHLTAQSPESLERSLWEALGREMAIEVVGPLVSGTEETAPTFAWERWHTVDDAAERLAEKIAEDLAQCADGFSGLAVLIPDRPGVRRSLKRALARHGIPEADDRDPDRLKFDERVKWALAPLKAVARHFERTRVLSWIGKFLADHPESATWSEEISSRAVESGLESYFGGKLAALEKELRRLDASLGGRRTCAALAEAHLDYLRQAAGVSAEKAWVVSVFETLWTQVALDEDRISGNAGSPDARESGEGRRAPALYWLEMLERRLAESPTPPAKEKRPDGLRVYRLHQAPFLGAKRIYLLGLPSDWLSSGDSARGGAYWLGARDRERLAGTGFAVRSSIQIREERLAAVRAWLRSAAELFVLDAHYGPDGRERESISPVLRTMLGYAGTSATGLDFPSLTPVECGAHVRWLDSHGPVPMLAARPVRLEPALRMKIGALLPEISATALDHYSRCPFQALVYDRWRLRDLRDPEYDLWPEVKGVLLHEAVRAIVASRDPDDDDFALTPREALDHAWRVSGRPPRGLFRSRRAEEHAKERLVRVLEVFLEKEREYLARTHARSVALDRTELRYEVAGKYALVGKPDRIDETPDGLFIIDYKTSSSGLPNAEELRGLGYRLQLPLYALASEATFGRPAIGLQFISLSRTGSRSSGLFFKRYNGKEDGKLTNVRSNSKSLVTDDPDTVWTELRERVLSEAAAYAGGRFDPEPKKGEKECVSCQVADLCGYSRRGPAESGEAEGAPA